MKPKANRAESQKPTEAELVLRIDQVLELLVAGASRAEILRFATETWKVSERTVDAYLMRARDALEAEAAIHRPREIGLAIRRYTRLFRDMKKAQDFKGALAAQKALNDLLGIDAPKKIAPTDPSGENEYTGADEILRRLLPEFTPGGEGPAT